MSTRYLARLLEPLALLPSQLARNGAAQSPEVRLIVAMIDDAIRSVLQYGDAVEGPERREFLDARRWLLDDNRDWPFAFANVCDVLALDVAAVRQRLFPSQAPPADQSLPVQQPNQAAVFEALDGTERHRRFAGGSQ